MATDDTFGLPPLPPGFEPIDPGMPAIGQVPSVPPAVAPPSVPDVASILDQVSRGHGIDRALLESFAKIESGFNPKAKTGSYKGLFQLSDDEFARNGGQGDIFDPVANATAAATKIKAEQADFTRRYGREPSASELYLIHQQGVGGADAHWSNPDAPAWQNMASTAEGRAKGERWAKSAIWGNVPQDVRRQFGDVNNVTSRDFVQLWDDKVNRFGGGGSVQLTADRGQVEVPPLPPGFTPVQAPAAPTAQAGLPPLPAGFKPVESGKPAEKQPATFFESVGRGVDQMQGMLYGGVEATGELVGSKGLTEFGREGRTRNETEAKAYGDPSEFLKIRSASDFGQWAKETIGSQIPVMGPMLGGAIAGTIVGGPIGGLIGAFVPGFVMSTGETQGNIKEKDPNAVAPGSAFVGGAAIAALDSVLPGKVGSALVRKFGAEAAEEIAKRTLSKPVTQSMLKTTAKGVVTGMATEGVTEALQEAIGDVAASYGTGKPLDPNLGSKMIEAGAAGALLGGIMGPMGGPVQVSPGDEDKSSAPPSAAPASPAQPPPASSGTVPPPIPLAAPDEAGLLAQMGYSPADVAGMSREEIGAEIADAASRGMTLAPKTADAPSAEPIADLGAQLTDLKSGKRQGVYLSPDNLANIESNPEFVDTIAKAFAGTESVENIDGKGGVLAVKDKATADAARFAIDNGADPQKVIGALTGAGDGKKPGADTVVQQKTKAGAVTRETLVPAAEAPAAAETLAAPGRSVETMPAEAAIARREAGIAAEQAAPKTTPPPLPVGDGSRKAPVKVEIPEDVAVAAKSAAADYTPAQGEANNRKLGHAKWNGLDISIETEAGGVRKGIDKKTGKTWKTTMGPAAYGYIKGGATSADGMALDVYMGTDPASERVWVIDEVDRDDPATFRQHKAMIGFPDQETAVAAYTGTSSKSAETIGAVTEMPVEEFRAWAKDGKKTKPLGMSKAGQKKPAEPAQVPTAEVNQAPETGPSDSGLGRIPTFADVKALIPSGKSAISEIRDYLDNKGWLGWAKMSEAQKNTAYRELKKMFADEATEVAVEPLVPGEPLVADDEPAQAASAGVPKDRGSDRLKDYTGIQVDGYANQEVGNEERDGSLKREFLSDARNYLNKVAIDLKARGFEPYPDTRGKKPKPGRAVSVNPGGPAVSGDVTLSMIHADGSGIYATIGTTMAGPKGGISLMARATDSTDRYGSRRGSQNQWLSVDLTVADLVNRLEKIARPATSAASEPADLKSKIKAAAGPVPSTKERMEGLIVEAAKVNPDAAKPESDPMLTGRDAARDHVVSKGKAANLEFGAMVLPDGTMKENKSTKNNTHKFLEVSEDTAPELWNGKPKSVDFHHNHPKSSSFSRADYTHAAERPALRRTWVHGHDGSEYWAEFKASGDIMGRAFDIARAATDKVAGKMGHIRYATHLRALMMQDGGVIAYGAELAPADSAERVASLRKKIGKAAWDKAVNDIRGLKENSNGLLDNRAGDRGTPRGVAGTPGQPAATRPEPAGSGGRDGDSNARPGRDQSGETADQRGRDGVDTDALVVVLKGAGFKTIIEARKFVKEAGILPADASNKQIDETIEAAVVRAAREIVAEGKTPQGTFKRLVELYSAQPNLASRTGTSVANQAYSTPVPLAYVAARLARTREATEVYEPTAGNGALLIDTINPGKVYANELDPDRAAALRAQGFKVTSKDGAEVPSLTDIDSVIMNPPFGAVKEGGKSKTFYVQSQTAKTRLDASTWQTTQIDHAVALNGLEAMTDDGRAVLILGGTKSEAVAERRKDYRGKAKREFYHRLYSQYNVTDHFTVSGDLYTKQGASWPVDVIVIEGRGKSARALPAANPPAILKTWDEIGAKLDGRSDTKEAGAVVAPNDRAVEGRAKPASDNAVDRPEAARGKPDSVRAKEDGQPADVRADADRGKPADVRGGVANADAEPRGDRDGGRIGKPADSQPIRPRVKQDRKEGATQAAYEPASNSKSLDTLIPVNMASAARNAIERVAQKHGSVDSLVADRLGYDEKSLGNYFSAEQVDAIASAIDNVERGSAFITGDMTGVGKGRIAAGMLRYAMRQGMVPVFVTEKPDLYGDIYRDLNDIGVPDMLGREPRMFITNAGETIALDEEALAWKQEVDEAKANGEIPPKRRGKYLAGGTAAKAEATMRQIASGENVADLVLTTYDQMNTVKGKTTARRTFLSAVAPRAMVVLDESHNAGGGSKSGWESKNAPMTRADFTREIAAKAKGVMFSSATYAKRPDVMDLYARTDMGKAVEDSKDLPALIQSGGVPMQQIVASMLAESGQYLRRERSFDGVEYALTPVEVDQKAYKQFSAAMQAIFRFDVSIEDFKKDWGQDALDARGIAKSKDSGVGSGSASSVGFASLMHNITNQMLLAIKAEAAAREAIRAHKAGEKPVIALANTNESFIKDFADQEGIKIGSVLDLDFGAVLERYLERTLRVTIKHPDGETKEHLQIPVSKLPGSLRQGYQAALNAVRDGDYTSLPISPIDWIRHRLNEAGMSVKEVTGRSTMIDYSQPAPKYVARPANERGASGKRSSIAYFNRGSLDALILNRSGSTGVSMHASEKFNDKRRRRMILAQAEGNIDTHMQMLGRVHRTGQVITPSYTQIAANIPAEARPTAVLMKKMASLNANTTGARGSAFTVDAVDFMNEVGDRVVTNVLMEDPELNDLLGEPLTFDENNAPKSEDVSRKATGRLVLLDVEVQEQFLARVQKDYIAELEQLDALGENPLEAKTVDIQAKTLETTEVKPRHGDSPFLDAVKIEKVSAKAQGRAMPPSEVVGKVSEFLKAEKPAGAEAAALASLEARGRAWKDTEVRRVVDLAKRQIAEEVAATKPDSRGSVQSRADATLSRWQSTAAVAYPGARVTLTMPAGDLDGIVVSVERTGKAKQIAALGAWTVKIAVPDSMRQLEFPMSKLFPTGIAKGEDEKGATIARSGSSHGDIVAKFEDARKEGRETRYMVTGNILGGFDQTRGKGRIVNYTTDSGELRPGILMGREFDPAKFMNSRRIRFPSGATVAEFLGKVSDVEVTATDGEIVISGYRGAFRIEMSAARAKAGKYFTDADVRKALGGKDFERRGTKMIVEGLSKTQVGAVIDEMRKIGAAFETNTAQDEAQAIIAQSSGMQEEDVEAGTDDYPKVNKDGFVFALPFKEQWGNPRFNAADKQRAIARLREIQSLNVDDAPWADLVSARADIARITSNLFYYAPDRQSEASNDDLTSDVWLYVREEDGNPEVGSGKVSVFSDKTVPPDMAEIVDEGMQALDNLLDTRRKGVRDLLLWGSDLEADVEPAVRARKPVSGGVADTQPSGFYFKAGRKLAEARETLFQMSGQAVINWLMKEGVSRAEIEHFQLQAKFGDHNDGQRKASRADFEKAIAERMFDFRRKVSWLNPERSKSDYELGGTRAFTGPRIPGRGVYFEAPIAFPQKLRGGEKFAPGMFESPHWYDVLKGAWASIRGSIRDVPDFGRMMIAEEMQTDYMQGANTGRRPRVSQAEYLDIKRQGAARERVMGAFLKILKEVTYSLGDDHRLVVNYLSALAPSHSGIELYSEAWNKTLRDLKRDVVANLIKYPFPDHRHIAFRERQIDALHAFRIEHEAYFEPGAKAKFNPDIGGKLTPDTPIDATYVRTMARDLLIQAARKKVDSVAIATSRTTARIQNNERAAHFYDHQMKVALKRELRTLTGDNKLELTLVKLPKAMGAPKSEAAYTVWAAKLSPETVAKIATEGMPLMQLRPESAPGNRRSVLSSIETAVKLRRSVDLSKEAAPYLDEMRSTPSSMLPSSVPEAVITRLEPMPGDRNSYVVTATTADGTEHRYIDGTDALLHTQGLFDVVNGQPLVILSPFDPSGDGIKVVGRVRAHEGVHALRTVGFLPGSPLDRDAAWGRLVGHAEKLRVLSMSRAELYARLNDPRALTASRTVSTAEVYREIYKNTSNIQERFDQEAVAHMVEVYVAGGWTDREIAPIKGVIDDLLSGKIAQTDRGDALTVDMLRSYAELQKIDKASPSPERIETLDSPSGKTGLGQGFTLFPLTDAVKRSVIEEGQPLFSAVPGKSEVAARNIEKAINDAVAIVSRIAGPAVDVRTEAQLPVWTINGETGRPGGVYQQKTGDARALITLAYADSRFDIRTTAGHEAYHHVETVLATPQELKLLRSPSEMQRATRHAAAEIGYSVEDTAKLPDYEIRAIAFQRYRRLREEGVVMTPLHIGIRRVWDRLARIFQGVRNALRGQGFDSMEAIFERARTGEMVNAYADRRIDASARQRSAGGRLDPQMVPTNYVDREPFDLNKVREVRRYEADVSLADVRTIQRSVSIGATKDKVRRPVSDDGLIPSLLKWDGFYYINDGNHRIEAARAKGASTIRAEVIELAPRGTDGTDVLADRGQADAAPERMGAQEADASAGQDALASFFPTATSSGTFLGRKVAAQMRRMAPLSDAWRVRLQDRFLMVRRQQEAIERQSGSALPLPLDVYVAEALYHGRAGERAADLQQSHVEPLVEHLRKHEIDGDQLGEYLYARHASERNAYIRTIDPTNDAGSGMTDAYAAKFLNLVATGPKAQAYADAAAMIDKINRQTRHTLLTSGLISRETFDAWDSDYQHYVPLRGFEIAADEPVFPRVGKGFNVRGPEAFRALGRRSVADNPVAYVLLQAQQAIVRSEKNRVNKTLLRLVESHPDPDVWQVYRGEYKRTLVTDSATGKETVGTVFVPPQFSRDDPSIVGVKVGGKQHYIQIHNPNLARALRGIGSSEFDHAIVRNMMKLTRFYAQLLTSWNPEFVVGNFFRDVQTALLNSKDVADLPDGTRKKMLAEALSLKSIRGIYNALRGDGSTEHARYFEEFRRAGGKISFMEYNDVDRIKERIDSLLTAGKTRRAITQVAKYVEDVNTSVENGVRLSTYIAMRKAGIAHDRAAYVARELTVNFNRKGEWGPIINSVYMFFNASVQGSTRMLQAIGRSKAVRRAVYAIAFGGMAMEILNYMIAGDDDDKENAYEKIKPWIKERNMIFMLPGRKDYIMIPMPYGYNVPFIAGQKIGEMARTVAGHGKLTPAKAVSGIMTSLLESFNPLGTSPAILSEGKGSFLQMVSPTILDPVVQVAENRTWYGGPIFPTKFDRNKPDSEIYFASVHPAFIGAAKFLNSTTGGNAAKSGHIDVSPEVLEHYAQFLGGGVAKFLLNATGTGQRALSGEEFIPEKTPILRRVYGKQTSASRRGDFFEAWNKVDGAHYEVVQLNKAGDRDGALKAREANKAEIEAYGAMHGTQRALSQYSKQRAQVQLNRSLSDAEKKTKLDEIKERENQLILRALETYRRAQKGTP